MTMAFKYQVLRCKSGHELLMVTLTHLDGLRLMVDTSHVHIEMVNKVIQKCVEKYDQLSSAQLMLLRHTILQFVQDNQKKVHPLQPSLLFIISLLGIHFPFTRYSVTIKLVCPPNWRCCPSWLRIPRENYLSL